MIRNKTIAFCLTNLLFFGCDSVNETPEVTYVSEIDFEEAKEVNAQIAEGFEMKLWAPGPLLSNAVSLSFDYQGVAYVSETSRRKSSDIDIRAHQDWMLEDIALQTMEDNEAFHLEKLATQLSDQNTWQEDFNQDSLHDFRDLAVQSEYIRRIWDSDKDGRADASALFADGFNTMQTGIAAGILHHNEEVFLTVAPDVWRLKDTDGDGDADERTSISHGYGIHIGFAGHDMSGLTIGPDGKVYWSIGDLGVNVVDENGKRWEYPNQGAVMRANPDGSEFEVFAHGLRNPQELAFDAYGNLISVDNDGDHPGETERYVHIVEGSDTGWRTHWQYGKYQNEYEGYKPWMDEKLYTLPHEGQPAYLLPPIALAPNGPAGLAYNPGTALSSDWKDYFFASYFTGNPSNSMVQAFRLKPKGATFEVDTFSNIVVGIVPTGVNFGPDGALYVNDWKAGYDKKPAGRIWKFDLRDTDLAEQRAITKQLLSEGMSQRADAKLQDLLSYPDMRVRLEAQFELVRRKKKETLLQNAKEADNQLARLHGIWGYGQLARQKKADVGDLLSLLEDEDNEVKAQTAKVLGEVKEISALSALIGLLESESPRVQFYAAEALGKLEETEAIEPLLSLLDRNQNQDFHLRHAITYALARINDDKYISTLTNQASDAVRLGAVVALRRMKSHLIRSFLNDSNHLIATEAAMAINDDFSIPQALPDLAQALNRVEIKNEAFIRRAINANLRLGKKENAVLLAQYAADVQAPVKMRTEALIALSYWLNPPKLDRVDNRYRIIPPHSKIDAHEAIKPMILTLLNSKYPYLKEAAIYAVGKLGYTPTEKQLLSILKNQSLSVKLNQKALIALSELQSLRMSEILDYALGHPNQNLRETAQNLLGELKLPSEVLVSMLDKILKNNSLGEQQKALLSLADIKVREAENLLTQWMDQLEEGEVPPALQLDVLLAAKQSAFESLNTRAANFEETLNSGDKFSQFRLTLYGGNKEKGQQIFYQNSAAQCLRCHLYNGQGGEVGPDLTGIASQLSKKELLLSLVDPNSRIAPGYGTILLKTKDGKELAGTILEETDNSFRIRETPEKEIAIDKTEIVEQEIFPSGMFDIGTILSKSEIRDLMAYLITLK